MKYTLTLEVYVGYEVGDIVGVNDGGMTLVGIVVGCLVGCPVGCLVGCRDGCPDGCLVGCRDG